MTTMVGAPVVRKEDPNLLTGRGKFVDNLQLARVLHLALARSVWAHARLRSIDVEAALLPGIVADCTAADFPDLPDLTVRAPGWARPAPAGDGVRFVGEPIAVVVARDRYAAADGVAAGRSEPEHQRGQRVPDGGRRRGRAGRRAQPGPPRLVNQRLAAAPLETLAVATDWGPGGLTV